MQSPPTEHARILAPLLKGSARYAPLLATCLAVGILVAAVPSLPGALLGAQGGAAGGNSGAVNGALAQGPGAAGPGSASGPGAAAAPGAAGSTGSASTLASNAAGAAAAPFTGTTTGQPDCSRVAVLDASNLGGGTCRPPKWTGNNGGATYAGVSGTTINIVVYRPQQNQAVATALQQAGQASNQQEQEAITAYQNWFNGHFELYGRKLNVEFQYGPSTSTTDPTQQQADASYAATTEHAFAVAALTGPLAFNQELARRGVPDVALTVEQREADYAAEGGYVAGFLPDLDMQIQETAEYFCKRLNGHSAEYAGDVTYKNSPRKLGIIWVQTYTNAGSALQQAVQRDCGVTVPNADTYEYSGQTNSLAQDATTAVDQMHQNGVTTVTCLCDPVSPIVFTQQATNQGWMPEWLMNSIALQDAPTVVRLYDQTQMSHAFGMAQVSYPQNSCNAAWYKAYQQGSGGGYPASVGVAGLTTFVILEPIIAAIEKAGPDLTAATFTHALYTLPATTAANNVVHLSLGNQGPGPYTMEDDLTQVWWSPTQNGPDGKAGAWYYTDGGRRYQPGQWPSGEPSMFTGSSWPPADPCAAS